MRRNGSGTSSRRSTSRPATLTKDQLSMWPETISEDTGSVIFSPALADGRSRSVSPDGPTTDLFGRALVPASPSPPPAKARRPMTSATFGLRGFPSSPSAALQSSLESRLKRRLDGAGSMLFALIWKAKATPSGCSVGAPHLRQRAWFVADAGRARARRHARSTGIASGESTSSWNTHREHEGIWAGRTQDGGTGELGNAAVNGSGTLNRQSSEGARRQEPLGGSSLSSFWSDLEWLPCTDGKARPVESGSFPLAHGVQRRASKLRAYGNAIVPQVAVEFIGAFMECRP